MRILLDTNIWRYIVDADAVVMVQKAALRSKQKIAIAPAVGGVRISVCEALG